jgi:hypothetical protein
VSELELNQAGLVGGLKRRSADVIICSWSPGRALTIKSNPLEKIS